MAGPRDQLGEICPPAAADVFHRRLKPPEDGLPKASFRENLHRLRGAGFSLMAQGFPRAGIPAKVVGRPILAVPRGRPTAFQRVQPAGRPAAGRIARPTAIAQFPIPGKPCDPTTRHPPQAREFCKFLRSQNKSFEFRNCRARIVAAAEHGGLFCLLSSVSCLLLTATPYRFVLRA